MGGVGERPVEHLMGLVEQRCCNVPDHYGDQYGGGGWTVVTIGLSVPSLVRFCCHYLVISILAEECAQEDYEIF